MRGRSRQLHAAFLLVLAGCGGGKAAQEAAAVELAPPAWAADAIWYQIFPERFRNGDPSNDPTPEDIKDFTPDRMPANWAITPWTWDWYRQEPWAKATGKDFYGTVQWRRYGGDLQGVFDRLDYLQELGVTALYFNPLNDAPSLHKYDARSYVHVDRNLGPDPRGDAALIAAEDFADPSTWRWSKADSQFLALVQEVHRRGMRIILDYSWNHTGVNFPAWQDILRNQQASRYADWYAIEAFDDPATPDTNEFRYRGWVGVASLPEWRKVGRPEGKTHGAIEGNLVPGVRDLAFAVTRRWLDPNGDGDPSDGVDGFRLDVADMVPLGFWREYRRLVRSINPEAYLVGEVWFDQWPEMYDPAPWLQGDVFDAVMHYRWFAATRSFFAHTGPALPASQYVRALDSIAQGIPAEHFKTMMNLGASHDTPRLSTSLYNPGVFKYKVTPRDNPAYRLNRPDQRTREIQQQVLVQQFTWVGAPHIWNGDEVGMWGADDPDERKPMVWADLTYDDEVADPLKRPKARDRVAPDTALFRVYQSLVALRKRNIRLFVDGTTEWLVSDDATGVLAYARALGHDRAVVVFNASDVPRTASIPATGRHVRAFPSPDSATAQGTLELRLPPRAAQVWFRE
jgi:cyclomaltodextrinase